jgi:hypothetical protein
MDIDLKEKKLQEAITSLETSQAHLRDFGIDSLSDCLDEIFEKCNEELMDRVSDAEPGILMTKKSQE